MRKTSGFTLVEIVVIMLMTTVVVAALGELFVQTFSSMNTENTRIESERQILNFRRVFERTVGNGITVAGYPFMAGSDYCVFAAYDVNSLYTVHTYFKIGPSLVHLAESASYIGVGGTLAIDGNSTIAETLLSSVTYVNFQWNSRTVSGIPYIDTSTVTGCIKLTVPVSHGISYNRYVNVSQQIHGRKKEFNLQP
jgi:hypothetical protein